MRRMMLLVVVVLAFAVPRASAQGEVEILLCGDTGFNSFPFGGAISNLGLLDQTTSVFQREDLLLDALRSRDWDLVIIRWFRVFDGPLAGDIVDELAGYVDGGGRLIFSMSRLDEQPAMWPILGIEEAVDVEEPLQDVVSTHGADEVIRRHPSFTRRPWEVDPDPFLPPTSDFGDALVPAPDSFAVASYVGDGSAAVVLSRSGRVSVIGPHMDYWAGSSRTAEQQIRWLLGCPADLDGDGELTVFDFFEFQNRFDSGGATGFADFDYDGRLDIFDFLEFFNLFEAGC
ncbi:MAG: GC-type dockerin domain-anchored protein [Phycisphaerales bacterium JB060]